MNLKDIIEYNDTLGYLVFSKIKNIDINKLINIDIRQELLDNYYNFYYFEKLIDDINYKLIELCSIEKNEAEKNYNSYIRYKKLLKLCI